MFVTLHEEPADVLDFAGLDQCHRAAAKSAPRHSAAEDPPGRPMLRAVSTTTSNSWQLTS